MHDSTPTTENRPEPSRRQWLTGASTVVSLSLAGCLFTDEGSPSATDSQPEPDATPPSTPPPDESANGTSEPAEPSQPSLDVDVVAPETVETGIEDVYTLSVTNTGDTATTVTYGVDVRRPQMVFQTLVTEEVTLEPDETQTDSSREFANWEAGPLLWTAWATAGDTRATTTASTTVERSSRSWGSTYQPLTGHAFSIGVPTFTDSYTGTRADGASVTVSSGTGAQLVVVSLQVRNTASSQRRTPRTDGFHLRVNNRSGKPPHESVGEGTTRSWVDLAPGDSERWTLIYKIAADVSRDDLTLVHTGAGYHTSGGWQVYWR